MSVLQRTARAGKDIHMYFRRLCRIILVASACAAAVPALAQDKPDGDAPAATETPPPIYEKQLLRISEILGSLSFLRGLCEDGDAATWLAEMRALLEAEQPTPQRRARLVGRFNHGFETYNSVYRSCTPSARKAIARYLQEGAALSKDVRTRYSQ